jgi:hypothetical protein
MTTLSDLPPDMKRLISSKLNGKNAIVLKSTTKDLQKALKDEHIIFTNDDYFNDIIKPHTKRLLDKIKAYTPTFNQDLQKAPLEKFGATIDASSPINNLIKSNIFEKDPKVELGSTIMNKKSHLFIPGIQNAIKTGIKTATVSKQNYILQSFKDIKNYQDLKTYAEQYASNIYSRVYWKTVKSTIYTKR